MTKKVMTWKHEEIRDDDSCVSANLMYQGQPNTSFKLIR